MGIRTDEDKRNKEIDIDFELVNLKSRFDGINKKNYYLFYKGGNE